MTSDELIVKNLVRDHGADLVNCALNLSRLRNALQLLASPEATERDREILFEKAARAVAEVSGYLPFTKDALTDALGRLDSFIEDRMEETGVKMPCPKCGRPGCRLSHL